MQYQKKKNYKKEETRIWRNSDNRKRKGVALRDGDVASAEQEGED